MGNREKTHIKGGGIQTGGNWHFLSFLIIEYHFNRKVPEMIYIHQFVPKINCILVDMNVNHILFFHF